MPLIFARVAIVLLLLVSYPLAAFLPVQAGWENGIVESIQTSFLMMGAMLACYVAYNEPTSQWRWFAWMVVPIWVVIIGREFSWGGTFLVAPAFIDPELGPAYSSKLLGDFKTVTRIILAGLLFATLGVFLLTKQYKSLLFLYQKKMMPWCELVLVITSAVLATLAEKGEFFMFSALSHGQLQTLEELFELGAYLSLFLAQSVVFYRVNKCK